MDYLKLDAYLAQDDSMEINDSQDQEEVSEAASIDIEVPSICQNFHIDDMSDVEEVSDSQKLNSKKKFQFPEDDDNDEESDSEEIEASPVKTVNDTPEIDSSIDINEQLRMLEEISNPNKRGRKCKNSPLALSTPTSKKLTPAEKRKQAAEQKKAAAELKKQAAIQKKAAAELRKQAAAQKRATAAAKRRQTAAEKRFANRQAIWATLENLFDGINSAPSSSVMSDLNQNKGNTRNKRRRSTRISPRISTRRHRQFSGTTDPNIEVIDLITSPPLVLPGVVNLDSDDELKETMNNKKLTESFDEVNYEITVKIRWLGEIQRFPIKKFQPFKEIMEKLAEKENATISQVMLLIEDKVIQPDDTPESVGYRISKIITGRIVDSVAETPNKKPRRDKNVISIKIQSASLKKPLTIDINKTQTFYNVLYKVAEALGTEAEKLRLEFDGDVIDMNETPNDLDFDGGEILDCHLLK